MRVLNLMWSSQPEFQSVHRVMASVMRCLQPKTVEHCFLIGEPEQQLLLNPASSLKVSKRQAKKWLLRWRLGQKLKQKITSITPDIVFIDGLGVARLVLPLLVFFPNCRALIYFHGQTRFKKNDLKLFASVKADQLRMIAVSSDLAYSLREQVKGIEVLAIPTFLDLPVAKPRTPREEKVLRLGAIGRLVADKNFALLVEAMSLLTCSEHKITLQIAGEGEEANALREQVETLQLGSSVCLLGQRENIESFYQQIDVLLVPSLQEGQGLVVQEALHYGAAVICTDLPVFREQLADSGYYLSATSAQEWANAILSMYPELLKTMLNNQRYAYAQFCSMGNFRARLETAVFAGNFGGKTCK